MKSKSQKYLTASKVLLPIGIVFLVLLVFTFIFTIASRVGLSHISDNSAQYSSSAGAVGQAAGAISSNFIIALLGSAAWILNLVLSVVNAVIGGVCLTLALLFRGKAKKSEGPDEAQKS